jgi:hypothetical protein
VRNLGSSGLGFGPLQAAIHELELMLCERGYAAFRHNTVTVRVLEVDGEKELWFDTTVHVWRLLAPWAAMLAFCTMLVFLAGVFSGWWFREYQNQIVGALGSVLVFVLIAVWAQHEKPPGAP